MVKTESRDGNRRREKKNVKYETIWLQTHHPAVVQPSASHWAVLLLCYLCCWPDRWWLTCRITVWVCVCVFNLFLSMCTSSSGCQIISYCRVVIVCVCGSIHMSYFSWVEFCVLCVHFFPPITWIISELPGVRRCYITCTCVRVGVFVCVCMKRDNLSALVCMTNKYLYVTPLICVLWCMMHVYSMCVRFCVCFLLWSHR